MNRAQLVTGLKRLVTFETAPYDEAVVRRSLHEWLRELRLPFEVDPFGNTTVRVRYGHPRRQVAYVAHLDHPAFRVTALKNRDVICTAEGGLPTVGIKGAKVVFPRTANGRIAGRVASAGVVVVKGRARVDVAKIKLSPKGPLPAVGDFAVLDLPAFKQSGNRLKLRVADDLAGCAAIVAALSDLSRQTAAVDIVGVFTRAEEVGFHGSLAVAIDNRLPRDTTVISVECSRAGGDVVLGKGPVVRLGDRAGPFHPRAAALLSGAAVELAKKKFAYQSALMGGGTCEATAFAAFDYASAGIALPLVAYHNQGARGVTPEEIDARDLEGATRLIVAAALRAGAGVEDIDLLRNELVMSSQEGRERLREAVDPTTGYPLGTKF
jgi:putative aminopeptidase FrvX